MRGLVSHLMEAGHANAADYPVAMVFEEIELVVDRENRRTATEGSVLQAAATTAVAAFGKDGGRKARTEFGRLLKKLSGELGSAKKNLADLVKKDQARDGDEKQRP